MYLCSPISTNREGKLKGWQMQKGNVRAAMLVEYSVLFISIGVNRKIVQEEGSKENEIQPNI